MRGEQCLVWLQFIFLNFSLFDQCMTTITSLLAIKNANAYNWNRV